MFNLINRFYKFKLFLSDIKVIKIPLNDFVFNCNILEKNYVDKNFIVFLIFKF